MSILANQVLVHLVLNSLSCLDGYPVLFVSVFAVFSTTAEPLLNAPPPPLGTEESRRCRELGSGGSRPSDGGWGGGRSGLPSGLILVEK